MDRTVVQSEVCSQQTSLPHVMAALQVWHRRKRVNYETEKGKELNKNIFFQLVLFLNRSKGTLERSVLGVEIIWIVKKIFLAGICL